MDAFARLGLPPDASPQAIQRRRRDLAAKLHPDLQPAERQRAASVLLGRVNTAADEALRIAEERQRRATIPSAPSPAPAPSRTSGAPPPAPSPKPSATSSDSPPVSFADFADRVTSTFDLSESWGTVVKVLGHVVDIAMVTRDLQKTMPSVSDAGRFRARRQR